MHFTKILCATDFSPGAKQATQVAIRLAREAAAELVFVHAWAVPAAAYPIEAPFPVDLIDRLVEDARTSLDTAVREAVAQGVKTATGRLANGQVWRAIVDELEQTRTAPYDLCVIGTHGRTGLSRVLLGSVAEKVLRHAPCSVLVVRPDGEPRPFHHALVPTDFSESAEHAFDLAASLVDPSGSISLLHVIEVPMAYAGEPLLELARDLDAPAAAALEKSVVRFRTRSNLAVDSRNRIGSPGGQILTALEADRSIDLVVMGSHGRSGVERILLGSVAEKVARNARCPVLVARRRK